MLGLLNVARGTVSWKEPLRPFVYSRHALDEIGQRRLDRAWIERVARSPLWTEPDDKDPEVTRCFGPVSEVGGRVLRVAIIECADAVFIVTAHLDRAATTRLRREERP